MWKLHNRGREMKTNERPNKESPLEKFCEFANICSKSGCLDCYDCRNYEECSTYQIYKNKKEKKNENDETDFLFFKGRNTYKEITWERK